MLDLTIVAPSRHVGVLMELMHSRRSEFKRMEYIQSEGVASQDSARVMMEYTMPLVEMLADFYNQLKSPHPRVRLTGLHFRWLCKGPTGQG